MNTDKERKVFSLFLYLCLSDTFLYELRKSKGKDGFIAYKKKHYAYNKGKREADTSLNAFTQVVALVAPQHCHILRPSAYYYKLWMGSFKEESELQGVFYGNVSM